MQDESSPRTFTNERPPAAKRITEIPSAGSASEQLRLMQSDRLGGLRRFNRESGDVGRFSFVFGDIVLVNEPTLVHDVLVTHARSFEKSPVMRASLLPLAGHGLFTSEGELWRRQRKLMAPMFTPASLAHFAADMTSCTERAIENLRDGSVVDIARETTRITMAIAGRTLFDIDTFGESDELGAALTTALEWAGTQSASFTMITQVRTKLGLELLADHAPSAVAGKLRELGERIIAPIHWPGERSRSLKSALAVLEAKVARMIADRRADRGSHQDLLGLLLDARTEDGGAMSDRQVRDEVLTLFVAGHETTATALAWSLMLLASHPEVLERVREEVDAIGRVPTMEDLPRLGLSLRVFKEALRLYPPVYMFGRVSIEEVDVGPYRLPKGTVVLVSPYALHRRPELWKDPERFDPSRFTAEEEARRHKSAYVPFSAGPRTCIGNHFALMEGPLVLATILRRLDLELVHGKLPHAEALATLRPAPGPQMRVRLRS